jgi:NhaP-type Na+/H+ or K+/H+ antiporter
MRGVMQVLRPDSHPALYSIVLGEGVLNDATSVALLRSVGVPKGANDGDDTLTPGALFAILSFFLYVFFVSCALGVTSGLAIAAAMKHLGPFSQPQEVALVGAMAFLSYLIGELAGLSGILSLFFCGMAVSHYALQHVSRTSRAALLNAFATLSYLLEGLIFLYVGRDALDPVKWANARFMQTLFLVVVIAALVALSRACFVFPCALLVLCMHAVSFTDSSLFVNACRCTVSSSAVCIREISRSALLQMVCCCSRFYGSFCAHG